MKHFICLIALCLSNALLSQTVAHLKSQNDTRQGVLRGLSGQCFLITAEHNIKPGNLRVTSKSGEQSDGELELSYPEQDIAIIKLKDQVAGCNEWNIENQGDDLPERYFDGVLAIRDAQGDLEYIHVNIIKSDDQYYTIKTKNAENKLVPGMSGGVLFSQDRQMLGLFLSVDADNGNGLVYQTDNILRLVDSFFPASEVFTLESAQGVVESAIERKDGSNQGQVEAIEYLIRQDYDFESSDMRGINLNKADLTNSQFSNSRFQFSDMKQLTGIGMNLSGAILDFANLEQANFSKSDLTGTSSTLIKGKDADFSEANLSNSLFFGADFRNADFSNTDLSGTVFTFCDLRGAKFDNAQLIQTGFIGSILDSVSFQNASFQNVSLNGSVADQFDLSTDQANQLCRSTGNLQRDQIRQGGVDFYLRLSEKVPTTRFDIGFRLEELFAFDHLFKTASNAIPICKNQNTRNNVKERHWMGTSKVRAYDQAVLSKANRRAKMISSAEALRYKLLNSLKPNRKYLTEAYNSNIENRIYELTNQISAVMRPVVNSDVMLLALLKNKVISPEEVNWEHYANQYLTIKDNLHGWPPAIAYGIAADDVPDTWVSQYKDWTMQRAKRFSNKFLQSFDSRYGHIQNNKMSITVSAMRKRHRSDELFTDEELASGRIERLGYVSNTNMDRLNGKLGSDEIFIIHPEFSSRMTMEFPAEMTEDEKRNIKVSIGYEIKKMGIRNKPGGKAYIYAEVEPIGTFYRTSSLERWRETTNYTQKYVFGVEEILREDMLKWKDNSQQIIAGLKPLPINLDLDLGLVMHLGNETITPEEVDWKSNAIRYVTEERKVDSTYAHLLTPTWKPFFPRTVKTESIPEDWIETYKQWKLLEATEELSYFVSAVSTNRIQISGQDLKEITIAKPNVVTYWRNEYQELFIDEKVDPSLTSYITRLYFPRNRKIPATPSVFIKVSGDEINEVNFSFPNLPEKSLSRNVEVKIKYAISKMNSFWYKEKNVVLVRCEPELILYRIKNGEWQSTKDFEYR